jgi:cell wall assembly regulator SMI1
VQLQDVLNRLDRWLEVNASDDFGTLNPPATASEIDAITEDRFSLVPEIRTWLEHHNGVSTHFRHSGPGGFIPGGHYPVDAERMLLGQRDMEQDVAWSQEDDNADFVVGRTAHVKWVPLSSTHVGTQLIVDHREGPTYGAVLEIDQDLELWGVVRWKSLSEMFQETLESLETGRPVVTAIGREIRPETVRESDGTSSVVWT